MTVVIGWFLAGCAGSTTPVEELPNEAPPVNQPAHALLDIHDPQACAECHAPIVDEWRESMHSRSHPDQDPVYAAMRKLRMAKEGDAVGAKCQKCHNPQAPDAPDSPAGKVGVACGACHSLTKADEDATRDGRTICLSCHEATKNPQGVPTCTTGPENAGMDGPSCASCHMPPAEDGHVRHVFLGPHRAWYQDDPSLLERSVTVRLERSGTSVRVAVTNTAGHSFPTGFPGRVAAIRLAGQGPDGPWVSPVPDGLTFKKVYLDESGNPTMPPFAASIGVDSRLQPREVREAAVEVPDGVTQVRAELVFHLLPPPAAQALGLAEAPEATPRTVSLATLPD